MPGLVHDVAATILGQRERQIKNQAPLDLQLPAGLLLEDRHADGVKGVMLRRRLLGLCAHSHQSYQRHGRCFV